MQVFENSLRKMRQRVSVTKTGTMSRNRAWDNPNVVAGPSLAPACARPCSDHRQLRGEGSRVRGAGGGESCHLGVCGTKIIALV